MSIEDQVTQSYDESFQRALAAGESIYATMTPLLNAAHERRMQLLDQLPLGDVSDKVCVDYGVGSWGFACVYPRLQRCAYAIGIDISEAAVRASEQLSAAGTFPYGQNYRYFTSRGGEIDLEDQAADIFFTGECIEHVENTAAFLDEIHRVLRPGGTLILTTPNADAYLYRSSDVRYCASAEHLGLMSYAELCAYLEPRFEITLAQGYHHSLHWTLDNQIADADFARAWAEQHADRPDLATGVIIMARRRDDYQPSRYSHRYYHHADSALQYTGAWHAAPLHKAITAAMGAGDAQTTLTLPFAGDGLILHFWAHPWSGVAQVELDGVAQRVNLYHPVGGFTRLVYNLPGGEHQLVVRGTGERDPRSQGQEIIFYQAIAYTKTDVAPVTIAQPQRTLVASQPRSFDIVFTTPAEMTYSERVVLYSTVFGLRPQRSLEIGTHWGGSSLVIGAALDDIGAGTLLCVDPEPLVTPEHWQQIAHRATLVTGFSPAALVQARELAGGAFDFALIDGDHTLPGVIRDIEGTLPLLAESAYLLFHDAHYYEVADAIDAMLVKHADCLTDCGMVSVQQTPEARVVEGRTVIWGGLRMVRYHGLV